MITTSKLHLTFFCVRAGVRYIGSMAHFNMWGEDTLVPNHIKKLRGQPREYKKTWYTDKQKSTYRKTTNRLYKQRPILLLVPMDHHDVSRFVIASTYGPPGWSRLLIASTYGLPGCSRFLIACTYGPPGWSRPISYQLKPHQNVKHSMP